MVDDQSTETSGLEDFNEQVWQVSADGSTVFQGTTNVSGLSTGMPIDMDVALQADGSLMATRVAVYNTDATNLSLSNGQLILADPVAPNVDGLSAQFSGNISELYDVFGYGNAISQVSNQFTNLQNLPFVATFNAANTVAGQNVLVTSNAAPVD